MASILVTGTSQGIGFETVLELARAGHRVYATLRTPEKSPELAEIVAREKLPVTIHRMDVDSDASVAETFAEILKDGDLDVLVNNAGIERLGSIEEAPLQDFRQCMETNYFGAIRCLQAVLPRMRERRSGCIVNVSSVAGHISLAPMAPYSASKFALEALSECLAQEVTAFNIRVAIVEPGIIATRMARNIALPESASNYPQGRRIAGMFTEALGASPGPELVAQRIREIVESDTAPLRHPTGPDAVPFLAWRAAQSDEQWVKFGSQTDEEWTAQVARDFGMKVKL
jgi:NAD(P)-dependent dehydrogenase (short-subunit alcohol dehydrogenase family)